MKPLVAIIMGSDSDLKVMQPAADVLSEFNVDFRLEVVSAHRTPDAMLQFAAQAEEQGLKVIIAGAGGAAHLPGMVASATNLPVIGVPVNITALNGMDSLLSIVQMPKGVPVATMAIDNSTNAALFAVRILAQSDPKLIKQLNLYREGQQNKVRTANDNLKKS